MSSTTLAARLDALVDEFNAEADDLFLLAPTREAGGVFVQQWGVFTRHSRRCWAWVVGNCPEVEVRRFITKENLYEEEGEDQTSHYENLARLGVYLGVPRAEIDQAAPLASTELALLAWETLTKNRSWLEGLAAKAVLERIAFPELRRIRRANWERALALPEEYLGFFTVHITADEIHGTGAYALLERYVTAADEPAVLAAARVSLQAMALLCNGIAAGMRERGATPAAA